MKELLESYKDAKNAIYEHVGFVEDWVIYPIDDCTEMYWFEDGETVKFHEDKGIVQGDTGEYYQDDIYTQRFYSKHVYVGEDFTMIFCDPHTDGMKWFRIFDNNKRVA